MKTSFSLIIIASIITFSAFIPESTSIVPLLKKRTVTENMPTNTPDNNQIPDNTGEWSRNPGVSPSNTNPLDEWTDPWEKPSAGCRSVCLEGDPNRCKRDCYK